ncbi:uncharacterized protein [Amphiura filiformis]|uniref:uncharacterized protein n=1 Tax=Amphiura filiformis TaxID=82378 RepID=UPI003B21451D
MEFYRIFLIVTMVTMICLVQSALHRNPRSETTEQRCEATCKECFAEKDSLKRMGCLEKCIAEAVYHFTCPESQSFLSAVTPLSLKLQREVEAFYVMYSDLFSAKDIKNFSAQMTEDTMILIDNQMPVIGRAKRAQQIRDFFTANPLIDRTHIEPVECGEEFGIIWVNGLTTHYDSENQPLTKFRYMGVLKRVDGQLREFIIILF